MAKYCANCGKELTDEQDICLNCGVRVKRVLLQVILMLNLNLLLGYWYFLGAFGVHNFTLVYW